MIPINYSIALKPFEGVGEILSVFLHRGHSWSVRCQFFTGDGQMELRETTWNVLEDAGTSLKWKCFLYFNHSHEGTWNNPSPTPATWGPNCPGVSVKGSWRLPYSKYCHYNQHAHWRMLFQERVREAVGQWERSDKQFHVREAPFNKSPPLFGHCPNSNYTPPPHSNGHSGALFFRRYFPILKGCMLLETVTHWSRTGVPVLLAVSSSLVCE